MINKIAAFLSPYLSEELAVKGLKKLTPKMGKYFAGATAAGYSTKQALDFLRQGNIGKNQVRGNLGQSAQSGSARPDELLALQRIQQQDNPLVSPGSIPKLAGAATLTGLGAAGLGALAGNLGSDASTQEQQPQQANIIQQYSPELFEFLNEQIQKGRSPLEAGALAQLENKFKNVIKKMSDDHKTPFSSILQTVFGQGTESGQTRQQQQQPGGGSDDQLVAALQSILKM